jgi:hypothetical protein
MHWATPLMHPKCLNFLVVIVTIIALLNARTKVATNSTKGCVFDRDFENNIKAGLYLNMNRNTFKDSYLNTSGCKD